MESLRWLLPLARKAGVERIIVNGSFVTDVLEPNDVDCALLTSADFPADAEAEKELLAGLPFIQISLAEAGVFERFIDRIFATDRRWVPKGMVEVEL